MRNKIGQEFVEYIKQEAQKLNPDVLLYGSTVYGKISSDLDIAFIVKDFTEQDFKRIRDLSVEFQQVKGMELDQEVPYESKLIYRENEVEQMLKNSPFQKVNGVYRISPIEKTEEFLSSKEMKYRLLLNILTTRSQVLSGDEEKIKGYKKDAWELLVKVIISYNQLSEIELDSFIESLYTDKKTRENGEMFLGYKTNIPQKRLDLEDDCERTLYRLAKEGKVTKKSSRVFIPNDGWDR